MYEHTSSDGRIRVYEGSTAFYVVNVETDQEACMGDGVDLFDNAKVGTKKFYSQLSGIVDDDTQTFLDAYFSEE